MTALTIAECKQIISNGKKQLTAAEQRIGELEALAIDIYHNIQGCDYCNDCGFCERDECRWESEMRALGLIGGDAS